jgi:hypothetical protein
MEGTHVIEVDGINVLEVLVDITILSSETHLVWVNP